MVVSLACQSARWVERPRASKQAEVASARSSKRRGIPRGKVRFAGEVELAIRNSRGETPRERPGARRPSHVFQGRRHEAQVVEPGEQAGRFLAGRLQTAAGVWP